MLIEVEMKDIPSARLCSTISVRFFPEPGIWICPIAGARGVKTGRQVCSASATCVWMEAVVGKGQEGRT